MKPYNTTWSSCHDHWTGGAIRVAWTEAVNFLYSIGKLAPCAPGLHRVADFILLVDSD